MPAIKTLICEVREDGDSLRDDSNFDDDDGTTYRILFEDDQIVESTTSPDTVAARIRRSATSPSCRNPASL